jgi:oxygen-independent coproporphyrinogen-3 oxidase
VNAAAVAESNWPRPGAAYVHIPFCRHRCGYCNFSVLAGRDSDYAEPFLAALEAELAQLKEPQPVDTLFIGGGTPTHLSPAWLRRLLMLVGRWFPLSPRGEYSVEANPGDIDSGRLDTLAAAGVNRLSLGVQSFEPEALRRLERDHSGETAVAAAEAAARVLGNVSIDLIFASPGQTLAQWRRDLQTACQLPIGHVSTYGLTYEKGTRFWSRQQRGELKQLPEEVELEMYQAARARLVDAGFEHYEVSNFARAGQRCRHNIAYWEGRGWYAAGPGAARFVAGRREVNHRSPTTYIRRALAGEAVTAESETLDRETWARERLVFGLRMLEGVDLLALSQETGIDLYAACRSALDRMIAGGWLVREGGRVRLSERGLPVGDSVVSQFF